MKEPKFLVLEPQSTLKPFLPHHYHNDIIALNSHTNRPVSSVHSNTTTMKNLDQQQQPATVTTKTKYRDFNDFLGRKQNQEEHQPSVKNGNEVDKNKPKVPYSSYKEFLENYNTKKFSSVRPAIPIQQQEKKTMKSEIFIQVNSVNEKEKTIPIPPPPPEFIPAKSVQKTTPSSVVECKKTTTTPPPPPVPEFLENLLKKRAASLQKANNGEINTTTYVPVIDETDRVDKNDPNVKKLVYNTYRGLLGAYNNKANDIISTMPRHCVREDRGIAKQLESIA